MPLTADVIKHHGSTDPLILISVLEHHGVEKDKVGFPFILFDRKASTRSSLNLFTLGWQTWCVCAMRCSNPGAL